MDHALPLAEYLVAEAAISPPEFIHAHVPDGLIAAVVVKHMCGARVVFDAHEYGPDAYLLRPKPRSLFRMIERAIVPHADAAFGVSTPLINLWQARFPKVPFALLPNASPLSDLNFRPLTPPDQCKGREGRLRVLFQGGFAPERGVDRVISEWVLVEGADLYLRGPDGDRRESLMDHARKTGLLNKSVFFLPSLSEDALIAGAAFANIGLIPYASDVENHAIACPNKLGQFMMAGLMILSTRLPFVEQIVAEAECGVTYDDLQKGALAYAVNGLANNRDFVDRSARKASLYARNEFHYEAFASTVMAAYLANGLAWLG
jgi:glycosyltransferase involved in cell wall biosynthesis